MVQGILTSMAKWGMAQVMGQGNGFDQILVQLQGTRHRSAQLRHFQRVGQAGPKQIALVVQEDLGFVNQSAKSR
jgi:hypothetical protein